jgi:RimJ/RimL family protein N-acetyltransferase
MRQERRPGEALVAPGREEEMHADGYEHAGRTVQLRAARRGDSAPIAALLGSLSGRSVYLRYFAPRPGMPPALAWREAERLAAAGGEGRGALVALLPGGAGEQVVGVGEYADDPHAPGVAEVALVVADAWQRRGVGRAILSALVAELRARRLAALQAITLPENIAVRRLLAGSRLPYTARFDGGLLVYRAPLA